MTAAAALTAALAGSANAFPFDWPPQSQSQAITAPAYAPTDVRPSPRAPKSAITATREKSSRDEDDPQDVATKAKGLLSIVVSIDRQQLTLYSDGVPITHSRVSTGQPGHATPTGVFSIIQKDRWHHSNLYDDAPMFYMQRITWSGVAMHQGMVPNYPASHGCIRLPEAFAKRLWGITRLGVRVIIARGEATPAPIVHAKLFTLKPAPVETKPEPKLEARLDPPKTEPRGEARTDGKADRAQATIETSADVVQQAYAALAQFDGKKVASDAGRPANPALDAMAYALVTPRETPSTSTEVVRSAYDLFDAKPRRIARVANNAGTPEGRALRPGPLSVFVSRKEGKLYVRKGFEPIFSAPVTFADPERPLGTHVYTALSLKDDNSTMRWNVVSMPGGAERKAENGKRAAYTGPASNATEALDRVNIAQDALDQISELMSPGATLIISDQGLGSETGTGTDFIVLTR